MDGISFLQPLSPELQEVFYARGHAHGCVALNCKTAATNYHLAGRLYLSKSGWLLLSVPNAFVRGLFSALTAPGAELPIAGLMNVPGVAEDALNAHISVLTADEVAAIGADKINERGQMFNYGLGPVKEIPVSNVDGISRVWAVQVVSPALTALRKSYGLSPLPNGDHAFHITVACRRRRVLGNNAVSKFDAASGRGELKAASDDKTTYDCSCSGTCTCPATCVCKKFGCCSTRKTAAHEGAPWDTPADKLPWRERVEVYAHDPKGRIYGGIWNTDKSFAVPGGGIDPGEDPGQAAIRELEEETGIKATNPRVLPVAPVDNAWSEKHRQEKQRNFAGSRTHFVAVDILNKLRRKNLDKWDAAQRKMYNPSAAAEMMAGHKNFMAPSVAAGRLAALQHIIANAAKKTAADILPSVTADNIPDSKFSPKQLATGVEDEREHTDNDQIAKEIAKDYLQTEPAYYTHKEQKETVNKTPAIILQLRAAKEHSDAKRYDQKNAILRELMLKAPNEWYVDDPLPHHMGVTHDPTKFKFHADPTIIPPDVKVRAKAAEAEPYLAQLKATPVAYSKDESVWRNFVKHLMTVKNRGDNQLHMQANTESWRKTLDPAYRHQQNMALARGEAPKQPGFATQMINRHGGNVLAALS